MHSFILAEAISFDPALLLKQGAAWTGAAMTASALSFVIAKARGTTQSGVFWLLSRLYACTIGRVFDAMVNFFKLVPQIAERMETLEKNQVKGMALLIEVHDKTNKMEAINNLGFNQDPCIRFEFTRNALDNVQTTDLYRAILDITKIEDIEGNQWKQYLHPFSYTSYIRTLKEATSPGKALSIDYKDLFLRNARGEYIGRYRMQAEPFEWKNGEQKTHYYGMITPADDDTLRYVESIAHRRGLRPHPHPILLDEHGEVQAVSLPKLPDFLNGTVGQMGQKEITQPVLVQPAEPLDSAPPPFDMSWVKSPLERYLSLTRR